jgi:histidinol dehydrogenase
MAYGTESIPKVDKIFGPGNTYVTLAKQIILTESQTSIDMPAGPSEVLVIADLNSNPDFIASDLLAQAEHGPDSQVVLVSTRIEMVDQVEKAIQKQLESLSRASVARKALENSFSLLVENLDQAIEFSNHYAPEHLIFSVPDFEPWLQKISTAGSVFLGPYSPEAAGDYASGTNHTLPTSGYARMYSGVSVDSFTKNISFQALSPSGLQLLGPAVETLADMEGLDAHAQSITIRLKSL